MLPWSILTLFASLALPSSNNNWLEEILQHHDLQIAEFKDTGRGLKTLRDRAAGDLLLAVPSSHALFSEKILEEYAFIKSAAKTASASNNGFTEAQILALGILKLREENNPSVSTLPEMQYSLSLMPDQIKDCLPPAYQRSADDIRKKNEDLYGTVCNCLREKDPRPTKEDFIWAISSRQSRSFKANDHENRDASWSIMLPGIDLINHRLGNKADLTYNPGDRQYEFRSRSPLLSGDEVTFSYGDTDNLTLLTNFGFCIPGNTHRVVSFDLEDILQAAQSIIPNIFPDAIISMFREQLKEQGTYPDLTMFAYDGDERSPRECLQVAVSTVQSLGEKLAEMPLTGLDSAITKKLLIQRKEELESSMERIKKVEVEDGWQPFVSSIHTLMHDELQSLC